MDGYNHFIGIASQAFSRESSTSETLKKLAVIFNIILEFLPSSLANSGQSLKPANSTLFSIP